MNIEPSPKTIPMQLCHVSSLWRAVARNEPRLWTTLRTRLTILTFLSNSEHTPAECGRFFSPSTQSFLEWWLSHLTPSSNLRLILDQPRDQRATYHREKHTGRILSPSDIHTWAYSHLYRTPIFQQVHQLEMLLPSDDFGMLNRNGDIVLANLESVTINTTDTPGFFYHMFNGALFPITPRLSRLSLSFWTLVESFRTHQISRLSIIESISPEYMSRIFTDLCPNLEYAILSLSCQAPFDFIMTNDSSVPKLRSLSLSRASFNDSTMPLNLIFPSLRILRLYEVIFHDGETTYRKMTSWLSHFPALAELYLDQSLFPVPAMLEPSVDFSLMKSLVEVAPHLNKVHIDLEHGVRNSRSVDFFRQVILSPWIHPTSGPKGGCLEMQVPRRGSGRFASNHLFEDQLIAQVAAYWKKNRAHLRCDVSFLEANKA